MRLDDLSQIVTSSNVDDWQQISGGPLFIYSLGEVQSSTEHRVSVGYHHSMAVYKADVNLRLAWGIEEDRDLNFPEISFPDKWISRSNADVFWQGALVHRWTYLVVDGGRCYLPEVRSVYDGQDEHPFDSSTWELRGYQATASDIAVARLLNNLVGRSEPNIYDQYMQQANIAEIPG